VACGKGCSPRVVAVGPRPYRSVVDLRQCRGQQRPPLPRTPGVRRDSEVELDVRGAMASVRLASVAAQEREAAPTQPER
jgi:hypothetical protein